MIKSLVFFFFHSFFHKKRAIRSENRCVNSQPRVLFLKNSCTWRCLSFRMFIYCSLFLMGHFSSLYCSSKNTLIGFCVLVHISVVFVSWLLLPEVACLSQLLPLIFALLREKGVGPISANYILECIQYKCSNTL